MSDERWIVVPKWDTFQHYKDREPIWIKVYTELNHSDEWLELTDAARGLLVRIWLLYGVSRGVLRLPQVRAQGWSKDSARHLESLNQAGFIEFSASKPLALARSREERRDREEPHTPPEVGPPELKDLTKALNPRAAGTSPRQRGISPRQLAAFTGCRWVRGTHSAAHIYDPLGRDQPPADWPYPRPSADEIKAALDRPEAKP